MLTKDTILYRKAFAFAVRVVKLHRNLVGEKKEFVLSKQLLRSGTSIGANISEANGAISPQDFSSKISIAVQGIAGDEILAVSPERNRVHYRKCTLFTSPRCR